ncbi:MAG: VOC family protein [Candidatus Sulfotelmatobacter sp.]
MRDRATAGVSLSWTPVGTLHHVGFVVASITTAAPQFAAIMDSDWDGEILLDPLQAARVTFLRGKVASNPLFELVEPAGKDSPVGKFLERGGGLHHLCYQVKDLEEQLQLSRETGALVIRQPAPAVAFGGRRIAWVFTKTKLLIEYLEARDGKPER